MISRLGARDPKRRARTLCGGSDGGFDGMPMLLTSVIDKWIGRAAAPSPAALEAVRGLSPAVVVTGLGRDRLGARQALRDRGTASRTRCP